MKSIKSLWLNFRYVLKESRYRMAAFWLLYLPLWWILGSPYLAGPTAFALLFVADHTYAKYMRSLVVRIDAKDSFSWDVEINHVKVGAISDADYASIRHRAFSDVRVYVAQGLNLLRVALNSLNDCYRAIPLSLFWIGVALAIFSPETISSFLAALQHAAPSDMRHAVGTVGSMVALMMMVSIVVRWEFGLSRFGFINRFDEAVGTAIRKRLGVAAEGGVLLSRWVDGIPVFADAVEY